MPFTRKSKIIEAWADPIGHDVLKRMLLRWDMSERRFLRGLFVQSPLSRLARTEGMEFVDSLVEVMNLSVGVQAGAPAPCIEAPWWKTGVAYKIYLPSFMDSDQDGYGDLRGVLQRLPYLEKLGVNILWLSSPLPEEQGGVLDFKSVSEDFGRTEDFEELARAVHQRGMHLIFDLDMAATGERHPWFQEALDGGARRDYYVFHESGGDDPPKNWKPGSASRSWQHYPAAGAWALRLGSGNRMALNWKNPALRRELVDVSAFWRGLGVDGYCIKLANIIIPPGEGRALDDNLLNVCGYEKYGYEPALHSYLAGTRAETLPRDETVLIADVPGAGTGLAGLLSGSGEGQYDMVLDESRMVPGKWGKAKPPSGLAEMKEYFMAWQGDAGAPWAPLQFESANMPRLFSRLGVQPQYRVLLAKLLGTWLLTMRGMPTIYQGEELGLPGQKTTEGQAGAGGAAQDAKRARQDATCAAVDAARVTMPWSAGHAFGFTGGTAWTGASRMAEYLNVDLQLSDKNSVLHHFRRLIALRGQSAALQCGAVSSVFAESKKVMCYFRMYEGEKWYIELNLTDREVARPGRIDSTQRLELSNYGQANPALLRPYEANLYRCE